MASIELPSAPGKPPAACIHAVARWLPAEYPSPATRPAMPRHTIDIASGNGAGAGTKASPFLADTAARFDEIMRGIPEDAHIRIGPGTFPTLGLRHTIGAGDFGWEVRSGWTISGAGEGATVIRLERWPDFVRSADGPDQCRTWAVIGCAPDAPVSQVVIEHLTVDANWPGLPNRPAPTRTLPTTSEPFVALHGIACVHDGPIVHRDVRVTGFYGKYDDRPLEHGDPPQARSPLADLSQPGSAVCIREACPPSHLRKSNSTPTVTIDRCTVLTGHGDCGRSIAALHE